MVIRFTGDEVRAILLRAACYRAGVEDARLTSAVADCARDRWSSSLLDCDQVTLVLVPIEHSAAPRVAKSASSE